MLVLTRKKNERIVIGDGPDAVVVTLLEMRGDKIRVGVDAPRSTRVMREELIERIERDGDRERRRGA